jgi:hypothetical protein
MRPDKWIKSIENSILQIMKKIKIFGIFAALVTSVSAASISFDMSGDTLAVAPFTHVKLGPEYTMYLGKYSPNPLDLEPVFFDEIKPNFTILSTTSFLGGAGAGYVSSGNIPFTDAAGFGGAQLFVWFTNGFDQNALITGFGAIPADAAIPNAVAFALDSSNAASLTYRLGSYDSSINSGNGGAVVLNIWIPEPSAALLGAIGALSFLRRRRH